MQLPPELWLYISEFLSDIELQKLTSVNRVFYHLSLDIRYREITIKGIDAETIQMLRRLQDSAVAERVQRLNILSNGSSPVTSDASVTNFRARATEVLQALRMSLFTPVPISINPNRFRIASASASDSITTDKATGLLVDVLSKTINVRRLTVDFWEPPTTYHIEPVFAAAWQSFGRNLKTLFLGGHLKTFRAVIESHPDLPVIEELIFQLTDTFLLTADDNVHVLNTIIAPFINSLSHILTTFTLWSWSSLDISSLLTHLGHFPHMKHFRARTPFNKSFASDPSGLAHFIRRHRTTLEGLQLWLNPSGATTDVSLDAPLSDWLRRTMSDIPEFPRMRDLQVYPTRLSQGFDALCLTITLSLTSLSSLQVRDFYMTPTAILAMLDALSTHGPNLTLRSMRINTVSFHGGLFTAMAEQLPALTSLSLYIADSSINQESFEHMLHGRRFDHWPLWNIGVWRSGGMLDADSMRAIARSIPSVRSFWNRGHMKIATDESYA